MIGGSQYRIKEKDTNLINVKCNMFSNGLIYYLLTSAYSNYMKLMHIIMFSVHQVSGGPVGA